MITDNLFINLADIRMAVKGKLLNYMSTINWPPGSRRRRLEPQRRPQRRIVGFLCRAAYFTVKISELAVRRKYPSVKFEGSFLKGFSFPQEICVENINTVYIL